MTDGKYILDATCGGRMMWFDKKRADALYVDRRIVPKGSIDQQPEWCVVPDVVASYSDLPFGDESFYLVVFDPPHIEMMEPSGIIAQKYGALFGDWKTELAAGFDECMRVLKPGGTMIFKWGEASVTVSDVLKLTHHKPAFGHTTGKAGSTKWIAFFKPPVTENSHTD